MHLKGLLITACTFGIVFFGVSAEAKTINTQANFRFVSPVNIEVNDVLSYGNISTDITQNESITLDTSGSVAGSGSSNSLGGTAPGQAKITGSDVQAVNIVLNNAVEDGGVVLSSFRCKYGNDSELPCDTPITGAPPTASGTTLKFGSTATFTSASYNDGDTAAPTFDIVVIYQ